jgi:hypothetical protein
MLDMQMPKSCDVLKPLRFDDGKEGKMFAR